MNILPQLNPGCIPTLSDLASAIEFAHNNLEESREGFQAVFYTKNHQFQVKRILPGRFDADCVVALELTRQKIEKIMKTLSLSTLTPDEAHHLQLFEQFVEHEVRVMGDMAPHIERCFLLIEKERSLLTSSQEQGVRLKSLFSYIRGAIRQQYQRYNSQEYGTASLLIDLSVFRMIVDRAMILHYEVQSQFPSLCLPLVLDHNFFSEHEEEGMFIPDDCLSNILEFLNQFTLDSPGDVLLVIRALRSENMFWERILGCCLYSSPEVVFKSFCNEINRYKTYEEVPDHLKRALRESCYIDLDLLMSTKPFSHRDEILVQEISNCKNVKKLKIGHDVPSEFLDRYFHVLMDPGSKNDLLELDLVWSHIQDKHFNDLSQLRVRTIQLSYTLITGACLQSDFFKTVTELHLSNCSELKDENVALLSAENLKVIRLHGTCLDGKCLSAKAFRTVREIDLSSCRNLLDSSVVQLSSEALEKVILFRTPLNGSGLNGPAFKTAKFIDLSLSKFLEDQYLAKLSSESLIEIDLSGTPLKGICLMHKAFKTVQKVNLSFCVNLEDEYLLKISSRHLKDINLSLTHVKGLFLESEAYKSLKRVDLSACRNLDPNYIALLAHLPLDLLNLYFTGLTKKDVPESLFEGCKVAFIDQHIDDIPESEFSLDFERFVDDIVGEENNNEEDWESLSDIDKLANDFENEVTLEDCDEEAYIIETSHNQRLHE